VEVLVKGVAKPTRAVVARVRAAVARARAVPLMTDGIGATASSSASSSSAVVKPLRGWLILAMLAVVRSRLVTSSLSFTSSLLSLSLSFIPSVSPSASVSLALARLRFFRIGAS
jgi:hypothetical protein